MPVPSSVDYWNMACCPFSSFYLFPKHVFLNILSFPILWGFFTLSLKPPFPGHGCLSAMCPISMAWLNCLSLPPFSFQQLLRFTTPLPLGFWFCFKNSNKTVLVLPFYSPLKFLYQ